MYEQPIIQEKRFDYKGYPCVILNMEGFPKRYRCGYVGLPKISKFYGVGYWKIPIACHGGLTYSHRELHFQNDKNTWWIGFDTGHGVDLVEERDMEYCGAVCKSIVDQVIKEETEEGNEWQINRK